MGKIIMQIEKSTLKKLDKLNDILKKLGTVVIAFSGGVDSTFLLASALNVIPNKLLAITARGPIFPEWETNDAIVFLKEKNINFDVVDYDPLSNPDFSNNTHLRCYYCKKLLFTKLKSIASKKGYTSIIDGTNADDVKDYRPGLRALQELNIISPLKEAGLTKVEIRKLSKYYFNLPTYNLPSMACLATRIPYGERITIQKLKRIEKIENLLLSLGFSNFRARAHGNLLRIEVPKHSIKKIIEDSVSERIVELSRRLGFVYITIDLQGYRTGSLNEVLQKSNRKYK